MQTRDRYDNDNVRRIFEAIAQDTIKNDGGTYQHKTGARVEHTDGYYVGVGMVAEVGLFGSSVREVASFLARVWPHTLPTRAQYIGTWIDGYNRLYVDYSVHIPGTQNLDVALACARRHGELAVWDCKNGAAIDVPIITDGDARGWFADIDEPRASVEDIYAALCAAAGRTITPENAHTLPRVSVTLPAHVSLDAVIERLFGDDAWVDSNPVEDDDDDYDDDVFCIYNDDILPDDQSGCYTFDDSTDTLTVWGFFWSEAVKCACGASLTDTGAVTYTERYDATLHHVNKVEVASYTVDSEARCTACGAPLNCDWQPEFV